MSDLRILCWGHRRAVAPLEAAREAFRAIRPDTSLAMEVRPLSDFEHQGMEGVARAYDLVVFDHPFCGDIVSQDLFVPLDVHLPGLLGPSADARYIGPSIATYRIGGHVWGAPIDAATQHAIFRPDLLAQCVEPVPRSWHQALALGERLRNRGLSLGIAIETPHALMTIGSLMANAGLPWQTVPSEPLTLDGDGFLAALDLLRDLLAFCPPEAMAWNSIDLHDAMVARDDVVYCPAVYGYATYGEADMRKPLAFADFAGAAAPYHAGSAIGGTALGLSRFSDKREEALTFIAFMLSEGVQDRLIPSHHGQPALVSAWSTPANDAMFNGFYSAVKSSMETVWTRPRHPGYIIFQREAGSIVAQGLRDGMAGRAILAEVERIAAGVGRLGAS
jgi:multiple sugar transport system substrate-binding protein